MVPSNYTAGNVAELIADIDSANASGDSDTITLAPGARFSLTSQNNVATGANGLPVIATGETLTIIGNGDVIERTGSRFRLLEVAAGADLTLLNLTMQGGSADLNYGGSSQGGAIYNAGTLTLNNVIVQNNSAWSSGTYGGDAAGGGIYSNGVLSMSNCTVANNSALGGQGRSGQQGYYGGSFGGPGGNAFGGGVCVEAGTVSMDNCTITGNTAQGGDGGNGYSTGGGNQTGGGGNAGSSIGGNGGNANGGGLYMAAGSVASLRTSYVTSNAAKGGAGGLAAQHGTNGKKGQGIGGGISIDVGALVGLDVFTISHVKSNHANVDMNIHGEYGVII